MAKRTPLLARSEMTHDAPAAAPLSRQLYDRLRGQILARRLGAGARHHGALQSRVGDGTWVTRRHLERREQTSARAAALANKGTV